MGVTNRVKATRRSPLWELSTFFLMGIRHKKRGDGWHQPQHGSQIVQLKVLWHLI